MCKISGITRPLGNATDVTPCLCAAGIAALPEDFESASDGRERAYEQETLEECMLATRCGSTRELREFAPRSQQPQPALNSSTRNYRN